MKEQQKRFRLGHLGSLNQVIRALGKTIRAMADGSLDSQAGARICHGLAIMRACLETQQLEELGRRLDAIEAPSPGPARPSAAAGQPGRSLQ